MGGGRDIYIYREREGEKERERETHTHTHGRQSSTLNCLTTLLFLLTDDDPPGLKQVNFYGGTNYSYNIQ
jgi:hypothetical protein